MVGKGALLACIVVMTGCPDRTSKGKAPSNPWEIDVMVCAERRYEQGLVMGSMWFQVTRVGDKCEVLLGGETESPDYDGKPTKRCTFERKRETIKVEVQDRGGPAQIWDDRCVTVH